jgi:hypothetical protein
MTDNLLALVRGDVGDAQRAGQAFAVQADLLRGVLERLGRRRRSARPSRSEPFFEMRCLAGAVPGSIGGASTIRLR